MPVLGAAIAFTLLIIPATVGAAGAGVGLGTAADYAVLSGQATTNTGPSVISGDLGVSPGTAVTGFPPGTVNGVIHAGDANAAQAQSDVVTAYNDAAGRSPTAIVSGNLGGLTLTPGVYNASSSIGLTGALTLDAQGDPAAVWVFQVGSTLTTASASDVLLTNGAQACNVYWQVGSSATIGTSSSVVGTIHALTSITVTTGTTIDGRALARNGQVSLDTNVITRATCATSPGASAGASAAPSNRASTGTSSTPSSTPLTVGTRVGGPSQPVHITQPPTSTVASPPLGEPGASLPLFAVIGLVSLAILVVPMAARRTR
jgi:hypothetical protein